MTRHPDAKPPFQQPLGRGPNGRRFCRWCWGEVAPRRSSWCSDECVAEYKELYDWQHIRYQVEKRDLGICVLCGTDTLWIYGALVAMSAARGNHGWITYGTDLYHLRRMLLDTKSTRDPWEADHIIARAGGGTDHQSNLRTLCIPCHKGRTAIQSRDRAIQRRDTILSNHLFAETGY